MTALMTISSTVPYLLLLTGAVFVGALCVFLVPSTRRTGATLILVKIAIGCAILTALAYIVPLLILSFSATAA